jgi:hypothetical protein
MGSNYSYSEGVIPVSAAIAIDKKTDDGIATAGITRGDNGCLDASQINWNSSANKCYIFTYQPEVYQ